MLEHPGHPYTRPLIASAPSPDPAERLAGPHPAGVESRLVASHLEL
ncbi:MAG: hypothetical protein QME70_13820 [Bacillota bacterium]|nr:hypothetical protein [Bacillota bacterium]